MPAWMNQFGQGFSQAGVEIRVIGGERDLS